MCTICMWYSMVYDKSANRVCPGISRTSSQPKLHHCEIQLAASISTLARIVVTQLASRTHSSISACRRVP